MKKILLLFILIPSISIAASMNTIGEKGDPAEVIKVIKVKMYDNYFEPGEFKIKKNQTIKFVVFNHGAFVHEFNIATKKMHLEHQEEMMMLVENEILLPDRINKKKMKELSKKNHSMGHSHSNSVLIEPNKSAEIIWKFNTEAELEAACNVPGHYEVGMIAKISK
jgi:uncharacterized cupredoxin-like copper-binding protein